jgi:hypothetical protein
LTSNSPPPGTGDGGEGGGSSGRGGDGEGGGNSGGGGGRRHNCSGGGGDSSTDSGSGTGGTTAPTIGQGRGVTPWPSFYNPWTGTINMWPSLSWPLIPSRPPHSFVAPQVVPLFTPPLAPLPLPRAPPPQQ